MSTICGLIRTKENNARSQLDLEVKRSKLVEVRENGNEPITLVLVLHLIGREGGVSFVDQSQGGVPNARCVRFEGRLEISFCGFILFLHFRF